MDWNPPTTADYAMSAASSAKDQIEDLTVLLAYFLQQTGLPVPQLPSQMDSIDSVRLVRQARQFLGYR